MMVDFSKWVEAWNTYSPSHKITPGSPAYICNGIGMTLAMVAAVLALAVTVYAYATGEDIEHGKTSHIIMCMFSLAIVGVILMFMSEQLPSHSTSSTKPPTLSQQIGRTWNWMLWMIARGQAAKMIFLSSDGLMTVRICLIRG